MAEPVIEIKNLKKRYRMGQISGGTLTADLQSWWARVRKKEDPNLPIDTDVRLIGKTFWALNGINLTINRGEAVGIIGVNGAGKSTLLKILSRITAPTEGEVRVKGRIASMLEVGTGFNGEMTGRENIYMNGAILGMTKAEVDTKMESIVAFSECGDFIDTPVKRYSSGMFVKLAFSVAAHLDSNIMIMDEVLAVGDANFQKKCLEKMSESASEDGKTVLYVSHNMATIRQLCTRCIVLKEGKVIFDGDVEKAISLYMESAAAEQSSYDLKEIKRKHGRLGRKLHADCLEFYGRSNTTFLSSEPVRVRVTGHVMEDLPDVSVELLLKGRDGIPVGVCRKQGVLQYAKAGDTFDFVISFDLSLFHEGDYIFSLDFFERNATGIDCLDFPMQDFGFKVIESREPIVYWENQWGHLLLNDLQVEYL